MATKNASKLVSEFSFENETKNAVRFREDEPADGSRPPIGTLYVTKVAAQTLGEFKRVRVTIEAI